jgi:hypothetical protein
MVDIFDCEILCDKCEKKMINSFIRKNGFNLRVKRCENCGNVLVHPEDKMEYDNFARLKNKEFEVKMRMVGNSYAVSIPREIVDFLHEQEKLIDNMVKLSFEDAGRLSLMFNSPEYKESMNSRVVKAREVKFIKNNKPVFHAKQFSDSAHPERNKTQILKKEKDKIKYRD